MAQNQNIQQVLLGFAKACMVPAINSDIKNNYSTYLMNVPEIFILCHSKASILFVFQEWSFLL